MKTTTMKFGIFMLIGLFCLTSCEKNNHAPNSIIGDQFKSMFPDAKHIEWDMERGYYVAEFRHNGYEKEIWFDKDYIWVLTKTEFERNVPDIVRQAVNNSDYRDWRIDDVDYIEMSGKDPFYIVEVQKGEAETDLYISPAGTIIREVVDDDDYHREIFD